MNINNKWPEVLDEMVSVIDKALQDDHSNAESITLALARHIGGRSIYIPKAVAVERQIKRKSLYDEFNGRNMADLVKKYRLSEPYIYELIREERDYRKRFNQHNLF